MSLMLGPKTLTPEDQLARSMLANLTLHPGWKVLVAMMDEYCKIATDSVIQLDAVKEGSQFRLKLEALQNRARVINDFCMSLLKSIEVLNNAHAQAAQEQDELTRLQSHIANLRKDAEESSA